MSRGCRIGVVQFCATANATHNMAICTAYIKQAAAAKAEVVFLPEAFDYICNTATEAVAMATTMDGPIISHYRALAKELGVWLSLGGFHEQTDNPARVANTHVLLDSSGDVASTYRKMHLFDVDVDGFQFRESEQCVAGNSVVRPTSTPAGNIGLAICYDVRFPELALRLRHMNADVITYPSAFAEGTGKAHWEVLLRARAIENQTYVVAAAQCGYHHPKRKSYGHALIVNPWGEIVASMGGPNADEEGVIYGLIDTDVLSRVRAKMPVIEHRRADIFGEVPQ